MQLTRCSDQGTKTLEEFYGEMKATTTEGGKAMIDLIARLRALPIPKQAWGLTSHGMLCLLAKDTFQSPWFVIVAALDKRNYTIEYLMPASVAPWPSPAYVRGDAHSEDEAVRMIQIAIDRSEGWKAELT
jgi:hypothetical protein